MGYINNIFHQPYHQWHGYFHYSPAPRQSDFPFLHWLHYACCHWRFWPKPSFQSLLMMSTQSNFFHHTNVVHLYYSQNGSKVLTDSYIFSHPKLCPWGQWLPISCPSCSSLHSWSDPTHHQSTIIFACTRSGCSGLCTFPKLEGVEPVGKEVNGGCWMVKSGQW